MNNSSFNITLLKGTCVLNWCIKKEWRSGWRYYRLTVSDCFRTFQSFAGFLWYLVTCLGFLLWCYRLAYLAGDIVATFYRRSSHKILNFNLRRTMRLCKIYLFLKKEKSVYLFINIFLSLHVKTCTHECYLRVQLT